MILGCAWVWPSPRRKRRHHTDTALYVCRILRTLKRRGHPDQPPPLASDGWGAGREALVEVDGRMVGVKAKVVYGEDAEVRALLGSHTAYVERTHLTSRHMNGRLVRTNSPSEDPWLLQGTGHARGCLCPVWGTCAWEDLVYKLIVLRTIWPIRLEPYASKSMVRSTDGYSDLLPWPLASLTTFGPSRNW